MSTSTNNDQEKKKVYDERCCQTGCEGCPYGFEAELDPSVPTELQIDKLNQSKSAITEAEEKYLELADSN